MCSILKNKVAGFKVNIKLVVIIIEKTVIIMSIIR
jgi:hypothetical protein